MSRLTLEQQVRIHVDVNCVIFVRTLENLPSSHEQRQLPRQAKFSMWGYVRWGPDIFSSGTWSATPNPKLDKRNEFARGIHAELVGKIIEWEKAHPQPVPEREAVAEEPRSPIFVPGGRILRP